MRNPKQFDVIKNLFSEISFPTSQHDTGRWHASWQPCQGQIRHVRTVHGRAICGRTSNRCDRLIGKLLAILRISREATTWKRGKSSAAAEDSDIMSGKRMLGKRGERIVAPLQNRKGGREINFVNKRKKRSRISLDGFRYAPAAWVVRSEVRTRFRDFNWFQSCCGGLSIFGGNEGGWRKS